ncbi:hypothetical protein AVEN_115213-1 [Araneus ventricosus]|uniref:Uncharacterized protein n=1 Tax=Araneus ventricosus TaxID=182803 RepID=A0A4Y1ZYH4_ARAVE|nr:hypothetical protein AVEN_115213-1 [Araneus ventricosus]
MQPRKSHIRMLIVLSLRYSVILRLRSRVFHFVLKLAKSPCCLKNSYRNGIRHEGMGLKNMTFSDFEKKKTVMTTPGLPISIFSWMRRKSLWSRITMMLSIVGLW